MASTYLTKTFASDSNRRTWTWSGWIKRAGTGTETLMTQRDAWSGNSNAGFYIASNYLTSYNFTTNLNSGSNSYNRPSMRLRDFHGWYHIVLRLDTTQATASDRLRWYVNGEQLTDFEYANYPSQNQYCNFNGGDPHGIGGHTDGANYFSGIMSHVHFCDGYSYAPTEFGETDSTTGEWKIKTSPSVSYGSHGFFILKDGNSVTDQSPNTNNWTVAGGTLTKTEDCPSNVFATYNSLYKPRGTAQYNNGNTTISTNASNWDSGISTLCATTGKYYFEVKINDNDGTKFAVGAVDIERDNSFVNNLESYSYLGYRGMGYYGGGRIIGNNGTSDNQDLVTGLGTFTTNDIIGCAVDLDNNKMYWHKNGTYIQNGGYTQNPSSGSYGLDFSNNRDGTNAVAMGGSIRDGRAIYTNYGNGYFGTSAVSSAGTNASGNGIFEYDVPTGYTALSTKGLNL
jgi:hypothetical protein